MPFHCTIRVRGRLGREWSDRLNGLHVKHLRADDYHETTLEGVLHDQAALQGVITTLGDLNLAVISVQTNTESHHPDAVHDPQSTV